MHRFLGKLAHTTGEESYEVLGTHGTLVMRWPFHSTPTPEPALIHLYKDSNTVVDAGEDVEQPVLTRGP